MEIIINFSPLSYVLNFFFSYCTICLSLIYTFKYTAVVHEHPSQSKIFVLVVVVVVPSLYLKKAGLASRKEVTFKKSSYAVWVSVICPSFYMSS